MSLEIEDIYTGDAAPPTHRQAGGGGVGGGGARLSGAHLNNSDTLNTQKTRSETFLRTLNAAWSGESRRWQRCRSRQQHNVESDGSTVPCREPLDPAGPAPPAA